MSSFLFAKMQVAEKCQSVSKKTEEVSQLVSKATNPVADRKLRFYINYKQPYILGQVMSERIELNGLNVAVELQHFIETQALPGRCRAKCVLVRLGRCCREIGSEKCRLPKKRDELQAQIDAWHIERRGSEHKPGNTNSSRAIAIWLRR